MSPQLITHRKNAPRSSQSSFSKPIHSVWNILVLCILTVAFFLCPIPSKVYAETDPNISIQNEQKYTIAFPQQSIPLYLYKTIPVNVSIDITQLKKDILTQAQNHPYLITLNELDIAHAMQLDEISQKDDFMQTEIDMGYAENLMANLNYVAATSLLLRIVQNFKQSLHGYFNPKIVARAWQMLAYAYIAQLDDSPDLRTPARLAFLEFIRLAPHIMMLQGRQPPLRVEIYDEALDLFLSDPSYRQTPQRDAALIANQIQADLLVFLRIVQDKSGSLILEIDTYQKDIKKISYDQITLQTENLANPDDLSEYMSNTSSQFFSKIYDKLIPKPLHTSAPVNNSHKLAVEVGPSYSFFITHPTSNILHGIGATTRLSYTLNPYAFIRVQFEINAFIPDYSHELYDFFRVYRIPLYIGISKTWDYLTTYFASGVMFSFSSNYTITKSTKCKTFGIDDIECNPDDVTINRDPFSFNIPFLLGANVYRAPFSVFLEAYIAATVYPIEQRVFRHPFGIHLGIQYHFY